MEEMLSQFDVMYADEEVVRVAIRVRARDPFVASA